MVAILAAVFFAVALIMDLADTSAALGPSVFITAGLLCLALHHAGIGTRRPVRNGRRWSYRR
ncbi:hypothetical protein [Actinophytocola oryzae]|uniref:Uncharacterized protein n=1 Tax=Actinophytocola oryzae TaxID=502181 RepID=A0A4R7VV96_9PSEU|nr:hypothetical protein [Actinophytocola oryzae]TDV53538.1 hypothetical protein CLV71_1046 [Actinophytocola oryzae]